jgi:hypothetical protein
MSNYTFPDIKTIVNETKSLTDFPTIKRNQMINSAPTSIFHNLNLASIGSVVEKERKIPLGINELIKINISTLSTFKVSELKDILGSIPANKSGNKAELVRRIENEINSHKAETEK